MTTPMMKCGHAANATNMRTGQPSCAICAGVRPEADIVDDAPPSLAGRTARCTYYGSRGGRNHEGPCRHGDKVCRCEQPSSSDLAFFESHADKPHDRYYCGCFGWD